MRDTKDSGREFSKAEAIDILSECRAIRVLVDILEKRAIEALRKPDLKLVEK